LFGSERRLFPVLPSAFNSLAASVAPDGKWMAYECNGTGQFEVYVTGFPEGGAKWQISTNGGSAAKWGGDGKELFFPNPAALAYIKGKDAESEEAQEHANSSGLALYA
jgi:Tol biopolymer transport system component